MREDDLGFRLARLFPSDDTIVEDDGIVGARDIIMYISMSKISMWTGLLVVGQQESKKLGKMGLL